MKVPGSERKSEEPHEGKWATIRYAIGEWGTTVRLLLILLAVSAPTYVIVLLARH
jgi:hypothetical protein